MVGADLPVRHRPVRPPTHARSLTDIVATTAIGATRLVEMLEQLGVELAFGLPGVHNLPIWKALRESSVRLVGVRHEQTAVYAADGYARASGRLGVALVTTGPGAANTLGATGEAMAAGSPVLIIATEIATSVRRDGVYRGALHETRDQTAMFRPVTKAARRLDAADQIAAAVLQAGCTALAAQSAPVYLGVPTDLLSQPVPSGSVGSPPPRAPSKVSSEDLDRATNLLAQTQRPLIWAGGGALRSAAGPLVGELALKLAAPVITTYMGRGLLAPDHPCAVPGPVHTPEVGALWDEADVVLGIGTDFDGMMTQNWLMPRPPTLLAINIDAADASKNYPCDLVLVGDARAVLDQLLPRIAPRDGLPELERRLEAIAGDIAASVAGDDPDAGAFLEIMERAVPPETVVVADMCIPGYWLGGYRRVPLPRKLAYPMGWGTLGFGFPASLGAALAGAGPTVCVSGDGGFLFACGELATVVEVGAPLTIVLVDDRGYGMLRFDQEHAGEASFGVDLVGPDFEALARSFGLEAVTVDGFGAEFEQALRSSIVSEEPEMIVVRAALKPPPTTSPRWYRRN
jgi:thiamine pyrophosphate-dependent acetolactate synthase large subunit-like protein